MKAYSDILRRRNDIMMNLVTLEDIIAKGSDKNDDAALKMKLEGLYKEVELMDWVLEGGNSDGNK